MSTREQGVDIVTRIRDETAAGAASTRSSLESISESTRNLNREMRGVGDIGRILRGGAVVGAMTGLVTELTRSAERLTEMRDRAREVRQTTVEAAQGWATAVPVFGRLVEMGTRLHDTLSELNTGREAFLRRRHAEGVETTRQIQFWREIREQAVAVEESAIRRQAAIHSTVQDMQAMIGLTAREREALATEHEERDRMAALSRQQAEDIRRMDAVHQAAIAEALETGRDIAQIVAETEQNLVEMARHHDRERSRLAEQFEAERALAAQEQAERNAEADRRRQIDDLQQRLRDEERIARERDRLMDREITAAGRLAPGARAGRFETGRAESFREQQIAERERERTRLALESNRLLDAIRREIERLSQPAVASI